MPTPTDSAEKVVAELDDETLSPEDTARDLIERFRSGDCPFCGRDPYHYVHNGVGMERVAVVCCDLGIALFQDGDEQLSRAEGERHEAAHALSSLLALIESQHATIERVERERDEARGYASLGCDAAAGGAHTVIKQGSYQFCGACGMTIKNHPLAERARAAEARVTALEAEKAGLVKALVEADATLTSEDACNIDPIVGSHNPHENAAGLVRQALSRSSTEVKNDEGA